MRISLCGFTGYQRVEHISTYFIHWLVATFLVGPNFILVKRLKPTKEISKRWVMRFSLSHTIFIKSQNSST